MHLLLYSLSPCRDPLLMLHLKSCRENVLSSSQGCDHFSFLLALTHSLFVSHLLVHSLPFKKPWGSRLLLWDVSVSYCCVTTTNITVACNMKCFSPKCLRVSWGDSASSYTSADHLRQHCSKCLSLSWACVMFFSGHGQKHETASSMAQAHFKPLPVAHPLISHLLKQVK